MQTPLPDRGAVSLSIKLVSNLGFGILHEKRILVSLPPRGSEAARGK